MAGIVLGKFSNARHPSGVRKKQVQLELKRVCRAMKSEERH